MALWTQVGTASFASSVSSINVPMTTTTAGNSLVLLFCLSSASAMQAAISSIGGGDSWNRAVNSNDSGDLNKQEIWYAFGIGGGATSYTVNLGHTTGSLGSVYGPNCTLLEFDPHVVNAFDNAN